MLAPLAAKPKKSKASEQATNENPVVTEAKTIFSQYAGLPELHDMRLLSDGPTSMIQSFFKNLQTIKYKGVVLILIDSFYQKEDEIMDNFSEMLRVIKNC